MDFLNGLKRSKMCGEFRASDIGFEVVAMGFVAKSRVLGKLVFMDLRDRTGIVQISFNENSPAYEKASKVRTEWVVAVVGKVISRGSNVNKNMSTGEVEISADSIYILSEAHTTPFEIKDDTTALEPLRLKYRYLDLRRPYLQNKLLVRDKICHAARNYLADNGFIDVETPFLGKSTPEGARDYLVPSRVHPGEFYALPQSPQIYKQLLMISGIDRYYQIARCFRDEDLRANRQPEFSQIDLEMSFVERPEEVMEIAEGLIRAIFKATLNIDIDKNIRKMPYKEAMKKYGSDKPDTRFDMQLVSLNDVFTNTEFSVFSEAIKNGGLVSAIVAKGLSKEIGRKKIDAYTAYVKGCGMMGMCWVNLKEDGESSSFLKQITEEEKNNLYKKLNAETGDIIFILADKNVRLVQETLGLLRLNIASDYNLIDESKYDMLWVVDFPLLEYDDEEKRYVAVHHPFTSAKIEDLQFLGTDPLKARANAYDFVINGQEAGGGSIRIHDYKMQEKMFNLLGMTEEDIENRFGFFVDAFKYGAPPHGGLAFGLDRLVMLITKTDNIKDVIAFPKVQNASCLMTQAPSVVDKKQLDELFLNISDIK